MTDNRRIFFNVVATYGRSLFVLACGLFSARWVLMALGEVDFGLYGVVGGMTAFIGFLNGMLAGGVGRFYAFAVGAARKPGNEVKGGDECCRWFNAAVTIHTVVPVVLMVVGYPIGEWAVRNFLTIPPERLCACVWVWRFVCLSCFVSMVNVPYQAMYSANQNIAELTIYDVVTTTARVVMTYYMVTHPSDWLSWYAFWMMVMSVVPSALICMRARRIYPACKIIRGYLFDWKYLYPVLTFSGWRLLNGLAGILSGNGMAIVVNKYLGPTRNAAVSVAGQVAGQSQTLCESISCAFLPAITNAAGEGDYEKMAAMTYRTCKFGTVALLIFVLPLSLEAGEVLRLWLLTPPIGAAALCACFIIGSSISKLTEGYYMAIFARGKIAGYQLAVSASDFSVILFGWIVLSLGGDILSYGIVTVCVRFITMSVRLYFGKRDAGLSNGTWVRSVLLPIVFSVILSLPLAVIVRYFLPPSFCRVCLTTLAVEVVFLPMVLCLVLDAHERDVVFGKAVERETKRTSA